MAVGTTGMSQLICNRMTEPFAKMILQHEGPTTAQILLKIQQDHLVICAHDQMTDCMDLYELVTNNRGLAIDKGQRLIIVSLREDRMAGLIRTFQQMPATAMIADGLTKTGVFLQLLRFCTSGYVALKIGEDKFMRQRTRPLVARQ